MRDWIKELRSWSFLFWFYFGAYVEKLSDNGTIGYWWFNTPSAPILVGLVYSTIGGLLLFLFARVAWILRNL